MDSGTLSLYDTNLESTLYGQVFQKFIRKDGFSANIIENYNNEILNKIPQVITNTYIPTTTGMVSFENVVFEKPKIQPGGVEINLYPKMSREKQIVYYGKIKVDMVHRPVNGFTPEGTPIFDMDFLKEERETLDIGSIPVMLGSKLCHLDGKTPEEKMALGECFNDPLGYFIVKSERIIINQENLRLSSFMIYNGNAAKQIVEGRITCPTQHGTTVTRIIINRNKSIGVGLQHLTKLNDDRLSIVLPIFILFKLLGMELKDAMKLILSFIDEKNRKAAYYALQPSDAEYKFFIVGDDDSVEAIVNSLLIRRSKIDKRVVRDSVIPHIMRDFLSNIGNSNDKLLHLAMYVARMVENMIGVRSVDDRDSWSNKRISTPSRSILHLFKGIWSSLINGPFGVIAKTAGNAKNLKDVIDKFNRGEIKHNFITAFGPKAWGVSKSIHKDNITESLRRDTPIAIYAQIGRISPPTDRKTKNSSIRMPHGSQINTICIFETPEGEGCGLIKNMATVCYISLERDSEPIINILRTDKRFKDYVFENRINDEVVPLTINGIVTFWCYPDETSIVMRKIKQTGFIGNQCIKDICIHNNIIDRCLEIYCDGGRPTCPVFVVDDNGQLVIERKNLWHASVDELIAKGCVEFLDAREQEWVLLAEDVHNVTRRYELLRDLKKFPEREEDIQNELLAYPEYSHCVIDPNCMFSISCALIPQAHRQMGVRTSYQAGMNRQALSQYHSKEYLRFDSSYKMLHYPTKSLFQTDLTDTSGLNLMPNGQTFQIAIMAHPDNPEDGLIMKEEVSKYANKFDTCKKMTTTSKSNNTTEYTEEFMRPPMDAKEPHGRYDSIGENGLPKLDAYIRPGDCIIGKVRKYNKNSGPTLVGTVENISEFAGVGEEGYVDRVLVTREDVKVIIIKVKLRQNRKHIAGDKMCLRYSQKGTVAKILPSREMPRIASGPLKGVVPDILINPHSIPSRMTMNMMIEFLVTKAAIIDGRFINATSFRSFDDELIHAQKTLEDYGLDKSGKEEFELPNGNKMKVKCFFGFGYYQSLGKHVVDKIQMRARSGGIKPSTRQPVMGRANVGGLKIGEMERDALISHGSSALLRDRMLLCSDYFELVICKTCGSIAITDHVNKINRCTICGPKAEIGVIGIPYVVKLLLHYLNACSIDLRFNVSNVSSDNSKRMEEQYLI